MARKKVTTTAMTNWDEKLASYADKEKEKARALDMSSVQRLTIRGNVMKVNGEAVPGNEIVAVVLGGIKANLYYTKEFDSDNPASPDCYAFGHSTEEMAPHPDSSTPQDAKCEDCYHNTFGSADRGNGKACANKYRLVMLPAGTMKQGKFIPYTDPKDFAASTPLYTMVPVTSVANWARYVAQMAASPIGRPPFALYTRVATDPEAEWATMKFELHEEIPTKFLDVLEERYNTLMQTIDFPFPKVVKAAKAKKSKPRGRSKQKTRAAREA